MDSRERFIEVMKFNKDARAVKWEFGYWGKTLKNWYSQGLKEKKYPKIPIDITTFQASLYTTAWITEWRNKGSREGEKIELPNGIGVWGGGTYWPNQGFPLDNDVANFFSFDKSTILVKIEQLLYPKFDIKILAEDEKKLTYIDLDGVERIYLKDEATIPTSMKWPITDWDSWNKIKDERVNTDNIKARFPEDWNELVKDYKDRDYPLALGGYPLGIFGTLVHLIGYENLFYYYYDKPKLVKDILNTFTDLWIALWEEVLSQIDVDCVHIWEDVSTGTASMVSPDTFKEFMTPYYKKLTSFLKGKGVDIILLDTDGDCNELIPLFMEAGITGLYPMEASAGMDVLSARKKYPDLQIMGGIPKSRIPLGKAAIDKLLEPIAELLKYGGYIPYGDHLIPPEVPWEDFKYYRDKLNKLIDKNGKI
jgi:hypothetical protein